MNNTRSVSFVLGDNLSPSSLSAYVILNCCLKDWFDASVVLSTHHREQFSAACGAGTMAKRHSILVTSCRHGRNLLHCGTVEQCQLCEDTCMFQAQLGSIHCFAKLFEHTFTIYIRAKPGGDVTQGSCVTASRRPSSSEWFCSITTG